jgi:hypothetical protein
MMHENEFYWENSFTILLSKKSYEKFLVEIGKLKCKQCGEPLQLVRMFEGDYIGCTSGLYSGHKVGYELHMDFPRYEKEAYIEEL